MSEESNVPWLEIVFGISILTFLLQLFPAAFWGMLFWLDVRNWSWSGVWTANLIVIVGLVVLWRRGINAE